MQWPRQSEDRFDSGETQDDLSPQALRFLSLPASTVENGV